MAAPVTFDGATKIIQVDPDITELDVQEVYSEWKRWVRADSDNAKWLAAFDVVGGDDLGGGLIAPIYFFLINGWTIRPDDTQGSHELSVSLNLYSRPSTNDRFTPVAGVTISNKTSDSAIQNIDLLEFSSFQNQVTIDPIRGTAGTTFPQGTVENPVDTVEDALTIAVERGLTMLYIVGNYTFNGTEDISFYSISGQNPALTILTFPTGVTMDGSLFSNCSLDGYMGAVSEIADCHLDGVIGESNAKSVEINITRTIFENSVTLSSGLTGDIQAIDCYSGVAGSITPVVDLNNADVNLVVRNYTGGVEIQNMTQGQDGSMDFHSGHLVLGATNTSGNLIVRGIAKLTNNSTLTVDSANLIQTQGGGSGLQFKVGNLLIPI